MNAGEGVAFISPFSHHAVAALVVLSFQKAAAASWHTIQVKW
jgi:hypothetical protein